MARPPSNRERRERSEKFQTVTRPKVKATRLSESGKLYVDYKDTETLRRLLSNNGKILSRKRSGLTAMDQRKVAQAVKRARFMALLPYVATQG
jgi:small subunit ribosomal protein S18